MIKKMNQPSADSLKFIEKFSINNTKEVPIIKNAKLSPNNSIKSTIDDLKYLKMLNSYLALIAMDRMLLL